MLVVNYVPLAKKTKTVGPLVTGELLLRIDDEGDTQARTVTDWCADGLKAK